jgi:hypothetical protein
VGQHINVSNMIGNIGYTPLKWSPWNKFHKNLPRDSFKIFLEKNVVLCEIFSKKSKLTEYLCPCTVYRGGQF